MGILGELWVKLGLKNDGLKKGLNDSKKEVSGFASAMKKLGGVIGAAFSVKAVLDFTHQTAELANKASGVKKAFDKLNSPGLLADLRKATMGTVDDLQLMQRAVQANNFKIPLNQLATYLEFATKRANETGESVDYLVDSIITGLGRQSVMILDNLGISAAEIRDRMKEGGTMADVVGKIIKEQMGEGVTEIDKATLATERLTAAWTNFQVAIGSVTSPILNTIKSEIADVLSLMARVISAEGFTTSEKIGMIFGGVDSRENWDKLLEQEKKNREIDKQAQAAAIEQVSQIKTLEDAYKEMAILEQDRLKLVGKSEKDIFVLRNKYATQFLKEYIAVEEQKVEEARRKAEEEAKIRATLIGGLKYEIEEKKKIRDLSANRDEVRQLNDEIAALEEKLKLLQMSTEELRKYRNEQMKPIPKVNNPIKDIFDIADPTAKGADAIAKAIKKLQEQGKELSDEAIRQQMTLDQLNEHFNKSIVAGISGGVQELARAIAGVEGANLGTVAQALLTPMADALASAGEMIIAEGIAVEAFKDSLKSLNGPVAIAAGAALVAVAGAVKAGLQAIGNNPTAASGYASSVTSYSGGYGVNTANYSQSANDYTLVTTLKGQDLLLSIERTQNSKRR